jgi:hypothetical protein
MAGPRPRVRDARDRAKRGDLAEFGMRRYSLWTGDLGLACYLHDCIEARARFPTMDVF